ncbi:MAG: 2-hydroxyglutaryl-CoA dehydratase [Deltaproteobacteria bacterium HGW-Deltaproteobacteria-9]|nr:MAG: 2-hydroxyglutaryl-CoA dehydratase [Deltaproteobacteria bacterium HGW-Deltaproteobacteria-9]
MIVAGCDIGSLTTKAVILNNTKIIGYAVTKSTFDPVACATKVMETVLKTAGLTMNDVAFCVGTGYGRERIPFVDKAVSELACHARGAHWLMPQVKSIIDVGGQDCKAMRLDAKGEIVKFITNDKCAAGTGRFLEVMAKLLGVELEELGKLTSHARDPIHLAATCTAWAQAEVIVHLNAKKPKADIAAGINNAMAARVAILARSVGIEKDVCMTGGVAKNIGVLEAMEKQLNIPIRRLKLDPQVIGALGAAVLAKQKMEGK